jgi:formate dehydrogenase subunit gamma
VKHLAQEHRLVPGQTSPDAALSVENVYCLGHCALSPAAMLDGEPVARLTEARLDALVLAAKGAR